MLQVSIENILSPTAVEINIMGYTGFIKQVN